MKESNRRMQDYLSNFPQPELNERKAQCTDKIPEAMRGILTPNDFDDLIHRVVANSPNYSRTGYAVFGLNANYNMVCNEIEKYAKANLEYLLEKYNNNVDKMEYLNTLIP